RRMEVYSAIFSAHLLEIRNTEAQVIDATSFSDVTQTAYFVGDSNEKCKPLLTSANFIFLDDIMYPSANQMSALSHEKYQNSDFEDVAYFEPFYLKDFMAGGH